MKQSRELETRGLEKEIAMLGSFNEKLDKDFCIKSLLVFSLIGFTIISTNLFSIFDITGIFKQ